MSEGKMIELAQGGDAAKMFLEQVTKQYGFDVAQVQEHDHIYISFLKSLSDRDRANFLRFLKMYLNKANIKTDGNLSSLQTSLTSTLNPLLLVCLKHAMEYYFL